MKSQEGLQQKKAECKRYDVHAKYKDKIYNTEVTAFTQDGAFIYLLQYINEKCSVPLKQIGIELLKIKDSYIIKEIVQEKSLITF
jgi:hypothetical protein